ncbi:TetR/AcrR family transcriptional regulator [Tolumonas lignilytica]|uniref:TetR/AcrR family transcriptional regulator n=1 Tax=Tolumonas lignilytica TaxID=1283284 RepID=UPI00046403B1|nr:TetR family transcriptional regulator [Tolumonas lignilytica]
MRNYQRARSHEEKNQRLNSILSAAESMFAKNVYEACNLNVIAADVGITKTALYRYFRCKELIFLEIYKRQLTDIVPELQVCLQKQDAAGLSALLSSRPLFCRLSAILTTVLERPLTVAEARSFKLTVLQLLEPCVVTLVSEHGYTPDAAVLWLMQLLVTLVGCWHICHMSPMMNEALAVPELACFRLDFDILLQQHIAMMMQGR